MSDSTVPRLVAFDLDGTLWEPEMYQLRGGAPFRRDKSGRVFDSRGEEVYLIGSSAAVLRELATDPKWKDTEIAYVSRTEYPEWAIPCLKTIMVTEELSMYDIGTYFEIYPGSKVSHFKVIAKKGNLDLTSCVFYDNENWNIKETAQLGLVGVYTPNGLTDQAWRQGLEKYAAARKAKAVK